MSMKLIWTLVLLICIQAQVDIFQHGVASGDPLINRVIIWTRITPPNEESSLRVSWGVATSPDFKNVVSSGLVMANAEQDYTVKVDVDGLEPGLTYYFRFGVGKTFSPIGSTKTLPSSDVENIRLAVVSNANWRQGLFNVYEAVSNVADLNVVLVTGDYIVSYDDGEYPSWEPDYPLGPPSAREGLIPEDNPETLKEYRQRHALYKTDKDLQLLHQTIPIIAMWDDLEFEEDAYATGARNHFGISWEQRKMNAIQAYLEWMPIRLSLNQTQFYRSFMFGNLAVLNIPETRITERTAPVDINDFVGEVDNVLSVDYNTWNEEDFLAASQPLFDQLNSPENKILGDEQLMWLETQIEEAAQDKVAWNLLMLGSTFGTSNFPDMVGALNDIESIVDRAIIETFVKMLAEEEDTQFAIAAGLYDAPTEPESWDGYQFEREKVLEILAASPIPSVVLSGDSVSMARELTTGTGTTAGVEFTTPGVSEKSYVQVFGDILGNTLESDWSIFFNDGYLLSNPSLKLADVKNQGFITVDITASQIQTHFFVVDTIMTKDFGVGCFATFIIERDFPGRLQTAECDGTVDVYFSENITPINDTLQSQISSDTSDDLISQVVIPLVMNATQAGEEVNLTEILQSDAVQSYVLDSQNLTSFNDTGLDIANLTSGIFDQVLTNITSQNDTDMDIMNKAFGMLDWGVGNGSLATTSNNDTSEDPLSSLLLPLILNATRAGNEVDPSEILSSDAVQDYILGSVLQNYPEFNSTEDMSFISGLLDGIIGDISGESMVNDTGTPKSFSDFSIPPMSPIEIASSTSSLPPIDPSGKWTSRLSNKNLLYAWQNGVGLIFSGGTIVIDLNADGTFKGNFDTTFMNMLGSGGSSQEKTGFWYIDEEAEVLTLDVTFCDSASGLTNDFGRTGTGGVSAARTSTCPIDDMTYQLGEGTTAETVFLGGNEYAISDL